MNDLIIDCPLCEAYEKEHAHNAELRARLEQIADFVFEHSEKDARFQALFMLATDLL